MVATNKMQTKIGKNQRRPQHFILFSTEWERERTKKKKKENNKRK